MNNFWKDKKVLITGHTGFKGSWLALVLKFYGAELYGISDKKMKGIFTDIKLSNLYKEEKLFSILDIDNLRKFINNIQPEIVFHFAAQSLVPLAYQKPKETLEINSIGTYNVLEVSNQTKSIRSLILATTDKVYKNTNLWNKEVDELGGNEFYSISKVLAENIIEGFKNQYARDNLYLTVIRSGNVIGGGDRGEGRLLTDLLRSVKNGNDLEVRNPKSIRPWQDILDSVNGYINAAKYCFLQEKSEIFNLSSKENNEYTIEYLISKFIESWGSNINVNIITNNKFVETQELRLDSSKAKSILNWEPKVNLEESINKIVDWEKSNINGEANKITELQIKQFFEKL